MRYKNTDKAIPEIAAELGVAHILEGSIRKVGERIRVSAQLIQAAGGHNLWDRDYKRELKHIIDVQDDVSQAIASALITQFSPRDAEGLKTKGTRMFFYAARGEKEKVFDLLKELGAEESKYTRLNLYCLLGEKEKALTVLKEISADSYLVLLHHPHLNILRDTPEYKTELQKAKMAYEEKLSK